MQKIPQNPYIQGFKNSTNPKKLLVKALTGYAVITILFFILLQLSLPDVEDYIADVPLPTPAVFEAGEYHLTVTIDGEPKEVIIKIRGVNNETDTTND